MFFHRLSHFFVNVLIRIWQAGFLVPGVNVCDGPAGRMDGKAFVDEYLVLEKDLDNPSRIGCFTCHSPHTTLDFALRTVAAVDLNEGGTYDYGNSNICAKGI